MSKKISKGRDKHVVKTGMKAKIFFNIHILD